MKRTFLQRCAAAPHLVWCALFIIAPLFFVAYYAFTDSSGAFSTENIQRFFTAEYLSILLNSVCLALIATVVCLIIAYPLAYIISRMGDKGQRMMMLLIMIPLWMNFLITTYSWMTILQDTGIINSILSFFGLGTLNMINTPGAIVVGMVFCYLPYMVLPIYSVMAGIDKSLLEASRDLGCGALGQLTGVIMPMSVSGVVSGITMVFVPSISTFYISQKLGGGKIQLIGDSIESQFISYNNYHFGAALSLVLMILILISTAIMNYFTDDGEKGREKRDTQWRALK